MAQPVGGACERRAQRCGRPHGPVEDRRSRGKEEIRGRRGRLFGARSLLRGSDPGETLAGGSNRSGGEPFLIRRREPLAPAPTCASLEQEACQPPFRMEFDCGFEGLVGSEGRDALAPYPRKLARSAPVDRKRRGIARPKALKIKRFRVVDPELEQNAPARQDPPALRRVRAAESVDRPRAAGAPHARREPPGPRLDSRARSPGEAR